MLQAKSIVKVKGKFYEVKNVGEFNAVCWPLKLNKERMSGRYPVSVRIADCELWGIKC